MGLDMYAYHTPSDNVDENGNVIDKENVTEFRYWRKHHDLHGWMENLYREKHPDLPEDFQFNCVDLWLDSNDLDRLQKDVSSGSLPPTKGFFFGNYPPDAESAADDLAFIKAARFHISLGDRVFYSSWW